MQTYCFGEHALTLPLYLVRSNARCAALTGGAIQCLAVYTDRAMALRLAESFSDALAEKFEVVTLATANEALQTLKALAARHPGWAVSFNDRSLHGEPAPEAEGYALDDLIACLINLL